MEGFKCEMRLDDASGFDSGSQDVLLGGNVVGLRDSVQSVEIVCCGIIELVFP